MRKTNRRYVGTLYKSKVLMMEAVQELSANAFKLLNLVYYEVVTKEGLSDSNLMMILNISRRPYFKAKSELKEKGYINIVQVGSTKYKWFVGKKAIQKDYEKYEPKRRKDAESFADLVLNGVCKDSKKSKPRENKSNHDGGGVYVLEGFEQGLPDEIVF